MRLSFVGELGWELHIPRPSCVAVYQAVMAAGAKHGLVPAGYRAIDNLSIEKGGHRVRTALAGGPEPCWGQRSDRLASVPPPVPSVTLAVPPPLPLPRHCPFPETPRCL